MFAFDKQEKPDDSADWGAAFRERVRPDQLPTCARVLRERGPTAEHVAGMLRSLLRNGMLQAHWSTSSAAWKTPAETLAAQGGTPEDLAVLVLSLLVAIDVSECWMALGCVRSGGGKQAPHVWIEGEDGRGPFLIDPATGDVRRDRRPQGWECVCRLHACRPT